MFFGSKQASSPTPNCAGLHTIEGIMKKISALVMNYFSLRLGFMIVNINMYSMGDSNRLVATTPPLSTTTVVVLLLLQVLLLYSAPTTITTKPKTAATTTTIKTTLDTTTTAAIPMNMRMHTKTGGVQRHGRQNEPGSVAIARWELLRVCDWTTC